MHILKTFLCRKIMETKHMNNFQKNFPCSYGYRLVRVDDNFSNTIKAYLRYLARARKV